MYSCHEKLEKILQECPSMGFHSIDHADQIYQSSNPNYYLITGRTSPYCGMLVNKWFHLYLLYNCI